jgi:nucleotide-binding universal stress UspA family protein
MNFNRASFLTKNTYMSTTAGQKTIFSKILVAIDGSDASMDAAEYAISISKQYNAEFLYALHVIRANVDLFGLHDTSEYTIEMRNKGEKYLGKVRLKANEKNIQVKTEIISSTNIAGGIVDYAEDFKLNGGS